MPSPSITEQALTEPVQPAPVYPSARYFQIHFEFLQQQLQQTLNLLESLQTQIRHLEQQTAHCKARQDIYAVPLQSLAAPSRQLIAPASGFYRGGKAISRPIDSRRRHGAALLAGGIGNVRLPPAGERSISCKFKRGHSMIASLRFGST